MFISNSYAQAGGGTAQQPPRFLPIILMFVVLYFLMIRPQMKRAKEHKSMLDALSKGDEVVTSGGIVGKVTKVEDKMVEVEIASGVKVRVIKSTLADIDSGTAKPAND